MELHALPLERPHGILERALQLQTDLHPAFVPSPRRVCIRVQANREPAPRFDRRPEPAVRALSARRLLRAAHYPRTAVRLRDPDGHVIRLT